MTVERVPLRKQLDTLVELQREGRARHVGVSNFLPGQIDHVVEHLPDDAPLLTKTGGLFNLNRCGPKEAVS